MKIINPFYLAQKKAWEEAQGATASPEEFCKAVSSAYERAIKAFMADMTAVDAQADNSPADIVSLKAMVQSHVCSSNLARYDGFSESYNYCSICDKKFR